MKDARFTDQTAIVTGGADGIGKVVATRLASEGAQVTIFDISVANAEATVVELAEGGLRADCEIVDIADEEAVAAAIEAVVARSANGRLDVVVNCAAIVGPTSTPITKVSVEEFERTSRINLLGTFVMTKQAITTMQLNDYGRVLNFASIAGKEGNAGMSPYSSTKAGVIGLVLSLIHI